MSAPFHVYPAIDLHEGRVVRLTQGDLERITVYPDPADQVAAEFEAAGAQWLHLVDLDAAFGEPNSENRDAISRILDETGLSVQIGGGLRDLSSIAQVLELGAERAILGTLPLRQPEVLVAALDRFGPDRLAVAVDAKDRRLRSHGWTVEQALTVDEYGTKLADAGVRTAIFTDTARDGTGQGLAVQAAAALQRATGISTIVSGGAASMGDIQSAKRAGLAGVVVGKALHDGRISTEELFPC